MHLLSYLCLLIPGCLSAQTYLAGFQSAWSDEWHEWTLYGEQEDEEGTLQLRFPSRGDWTQWTYRLDDRSGTIQTKWPDRLDEWELRGNGQVVTARALWRNDPREWRISDGTRQYTFKTRYGNRWDEWELRDETHGGFRVFTSFENDIREWVVEDELLEEIPFATRMMLVFVAMYQSLPRE